MVLFSGRCPLWARRCKRLPTHWGIKAPLPYTMYSANKDVQFSNFQKPYDFEILKM